MGFSVAPLALPLLPKGAGSSALELQAMKKAISLNPQIASEAATASMGIPTLTPSSAQNSFLALGPKALNPLDGTKGHTEAEVKKASQDFEGIFLRMVFKEMRNSVEKSSLFGNSRAMEFFEEMHDEQLSQQLAASGGLGIGTMVYQSLQKTILPHQKTFSSYKPYS